MDLLSILKGSKTMDSNWQVDAKQYIKEYLQKNINDKKVTVLA